MQLSSVNIALELALIADLRKTSTQKHENDKMQMWNINTQVNN